MEFAGSQKIIPLTFLELCVKGNMCVTKLATKNLSHLSALEKI